MIEIGQELVPRLQKVTQTGISAFHESFGGSNPIHTDPAAAKQSGMGATLQHAARTLYPIYAMLFERYRDGLTRGGTLETKFIAAVTPGDEITCHCRAVERRYEAGQQILMFETWAVNQNGDKVLVGTASVNEAGAKAS